MTRSRYSASVRRLQRKKRKSGLFWIVVCLLLLLGVFLFQGWRSATARINRAATLFMERVAAGDEAGAAALLEMNGNTLALDQWIELFRDPAIEYSGVSGARLTGLTSGQADVAFRVENIALTVPLELAFRETAWRVSALPAVTNLAGAFVEAETGGRLRLLWQGDSLVLNAARPYGLAFGDVVETLIVADTAVRVTRLEAAELSRLLLRGDAVLEGELEGIIPLSDSFAVYRTGGGMVQAGSAGELLIGQRGIKLYLSDGAAVAVRVEEEGAAVETIRVLLRQNLDDLSDQTLGHYRLRLSSESGCVVEDRVAQRSYSFAAGELLTVEPAGDGIALIPPGGTLLQFDNRIFFEPLPPGRMVVEGLPRSYWEGTSPAYRGLLEIINRDGRLVLVNEVSFEEYLYTVVPSEMPLSFGLEPLKAQAVATRSYAYTAIFANRFSGYGAHIDDSVLSQVYNNMPEYPLSREAVEATAGEVLFYGDTVADTRFFSTSCGYTANAHEVWHDSVTGNFPGEAVPYLQAAPQILTETVDLSDEAAVRRFLKEVEWPAYDFQSPYFRWEVEMSGAEVEAALNRNLTERYAAQPDFVLTLEGGEFRSMELPRIPLGRLRDLRVIERGAGGNIMVLELEGTNGVYRIIKEYNIRLTLRPVQYLDGEGPVVLRCHNGATYENYSILPSAFAVFDLIKDASGHVERLHIFGGGNGHGVGMSQYGARGMAQQGFNYRQILQHFYPGTELKALY